MTVSFRGHDMIFTCSVSERKFSNTDNVFNPYTTDVHFMGHRQTVQNQIRSV